MGTGTSKAGTRSINALKIIKRMQQPSDITSQSEKNSISSDQKFAMPPTAKGLNGQDPAERTDGGDDVGGLSSNPLKSNTDMTDQDKTIEHEMNDPAYKKKADDDAGEKEEKKVLTEEEIHEKIDSFYKTISDIISFCGSIKVRDRSQTNEPYTSEFRTFAHHLAKSYFHFKPGKTPYLFIKEFRLKVGKWLVDEKCIQLLCDVTTEGLKKRDFYNEEWKTVINFFLPIKNTVLTMINYSDLCREIKLAIGSHQNLISSMVDFINDMKDKHLQKELSDNLNKLLKWTISIFHNCATLDENVPLFRDFGVIEAILPYLNSPLATMRLTALATLADIVNEEEAELLQANPAIYKFLIKTLGLSLDDETHKNVGWSAEELTRTVRQLARNDANKKILVDFGVLPLLTKLFDIGNEIEIKETLDCLWILSFNNGNKDAMMNECSLVDRVVKEYRAGSKAMKYSCHGLLWSLKGHLMDDDKYKDIGHEVCSSKGQLPGDGTLVSPESPEALKGTQFEGHVMISYQWANQETIKRIAHEMRTNNIPIWLDIDYMGGSTLQAMARAVENASVVIVAMSQKYKDSPNTRAEAEYAFQQRKPIIPLMMQQEYRPDGWLGLILGSKLYYDFSGKYSFESRMSGLLKAIQTINDAVDSKIATQPLMTMTKSVVLTSPTKPVAAVVARHDPINQNKIKAWQSADIKQWLAKFKLDTVDSLLKLSGEEVLFLFKLKSEAPDFFYHCLETKLQLQSLLELSRASDAICSLDA